MRRRWPCLLVLAAAFLATSVGAYDHHLTSEDVRDAYFLGTNHDDAAKFLSSYLHTFHPQNANLPYVAEIEARTPYAQVVANSLQSWVDYSALEAEEEHQEKPDIVQVRVKILYPLRGEPGPILPPPGCGGAVHMDDPLQCFHNFQFRFGQAGQLTPDNVYGLPIYSINSSSFTGGDLWFTFPANEVRSQTLHVTVVDAGGPNATATFDLATLR